MAKPKTNPGNENPIASPLALAGDISGKIVIFHAGSLTVPFSEMARRFEARHPGVDILREAGGSTSMAHLISEQGQPADIMVSADDTVIDHILIPEHAGWNIRFACNQLVLCHTDHSQAADEINPDNWLDVLSRSGIVWGHSDPNLDPCGYRSLMVLQLAEKLYKKTGWSEKLLTNRSEKNVRPKSSDLVSLLKAGQMDYAWEYLSVAVQHGLKFVTLPSEINLGDYRHDDFYRQAKVEVTGASPGTLITKTGKACTYGLTMLKTAPNPAAAAAFLAYLLAPDGGLAILKKMGQPPLNPPWVPDKEMKKQLPEQLRHLVDVKP